MLNLFIVYNMELNENADPYKYGYSGCSIVMRNGNTIGKEAKNNTATNKTAS